MKLNKPWYDIWEVFFISTFYAVVSTWPYDQWAVTISTPAIYIANLFFPGSTVAIDIVASIIGGFVGYYFAILLRSNGDNHWYNNSWVWWTGTLYWLIFSFFWQEPSSIITPFIAPSKIIADNFGVMAGAISAVIIGGLIGYKAKQVLKK